VQGEGEAKEKNRVFQKPGLMDEKREKLVEDE